MNLERKLQNQRYHSAYRSRLMTILNHLHLLKHAKQRSYFHDKSFCQSIQDNKSDVIENMFLSKEIPYYCYQFFFISEVVFLVVTGTCVEGKILI